MVRWRNLPAPARLVCRRRDVHVEHLHAFQFVDDVLYAGGQLAGIAFARRTCSARKLGCRRRSAPRQGRSARRAPAELLDE